MSAPATVALGQAGTVRIVTRASRRWRKPAYCFVAVLEHKGVLSAEVRWPFVEPTEVTLDDDRRSFECVRDGQSFGFEARVDTARHSPIILGTYTHGLDKAVLDWVRVAVVRSAGLARAFNGRLEGGDKVEITIAGIGGIREVTGLSTSGEVTFLPSSTSVLVGGAEGAAQFPIVCSPKSTFQRSTTFHIPTAQPHRMDPDFDRQTRTRIPTQVHSYSFVPALGRSLRFGTALAVLPDQPQSVEDHKRDSREDHAVWEDGDCQDQCRQEEQLVLGEAFFVQQAVVAHPDRY